MRLFLLLTLLALTGGTRAQTPDTTDWRRYFPFGQGDVWEYEYTSGRTLRQHVVGDTLVDGRRYPLLYRQDFSPTGEPSPLVFRVYVVFDTAAAHVTYPQGFADCPLDAPFNASITCLGTATWVSGGYDGVLVFRRGAEVDTVRTAVKSYDNGISVFTYAAGFGLVYLLCGECSDPERSLRAARIGGVTYGELRYPIVATEPAPAEAGALALSVRPSPAHGRATATLTLEGTRAVVVEVFDMLGRRVLTRDLGALPAGRHEAPLDLARLAPGPYAIRVVAGERSAVRTLTIVR